MGDKSSIQWTDATWNPVRGCTKVSAGCKNCYAETFAERFRGVPGHPFEQGFDLRLVPEALALPLRWRRPRRIFVNSVSDLFHEGVPDDYIAAVFGVMAAAPQHTFQVLTKRPERARRWFSQGMDVQAAACARLDEIGFERGCGSAFEPEVWPLPNVWLGVSVEDQSAADERIPHLLTTPAAVRFLSCEPLLGPVDLRPWLMKLATSGPGWKLTGGTALEIADKVLDWVIVGGESGPGSRPMHLAWARSLVSQCRDAKVPVFVKQLGRLIVERNGAVFAPHYGSRDPKRGDPAGWPEDLRVRQMPGEVA
jgi:protein gp37